ncbi:MAG TPA: DinB family protein [Candidatus Sulfotelmatobacter sp.]|nr:DinB family protein [Candidatus Sulfotelmatobacter sp.]
MPKKTPTDPHRPLREHLLYLLSDGGAHAKFDDVIKDLPPNLRGEKPSNYPHSFWMLLEHLRVAQWDILEFSRNPKYKHLKWPEEYWPATDAPLSAAAWNESVKSFRADLKAMEDLVANPKTDLFARIPWGDGQTILREALLVADHNAYHLGQLVDVRRLLGAWKS